MKESGVSVFKDKGGCGGGKSNSKRGVGLYRSSKRLGSKITKVIQRNYKDN